MTLHLSHTNATILTVEDDPVVRESIAIWLEDTGFRVLQADNGLAGLKLFRDRQPDVVLLDLGIPQLEGSRLLELIASESPDTPVIVVSGRANIDDAIEAFKAGARDYITKPIMNMDMLEKTVRNCIEHKSLKERVTLAENRYYTLVQNLPVIVFAINDKLQMQFVNATTENILGYNQEAVLGDPTWFISHVHHMERSTVEQAFAKAFSQADTPFLLEFQFKHASGYYMQLQARSINVTPPDPMGRFEGRMEGVITDITERAFLDKVLVQREKLNTLGAMADEIAHEFRNPVFALGGFARRLHDKMPNLPEADIILSEAKRLEELLDRVKDYLKPVSVTNKQCSLNAIIRFCIELLRPRLARTLIQPQLELSETLDTIMSDQDILTQISINLLTNALEQLPEGALLRIRSYETPNRQAMDIFIPSNGCISRDPEHLLLPFEQDGPVRNLAVSYRLVKNVDGFLSVQQDEKHLTLTLSLPTGKSEEIMSHRPL